MFEYLQRVDHVVGFVGDPVGFGHDDEPDRADPILQRHIGLEALGVGTGFTEQRGLRANPRAEVEDARVRHIPDSGTNFLDEERVVVLGVRHHPEIVATV